MTVFYLCFARCRMFFASGFLSLIVFAFGISSLYPEAAGFLNYQGRISVGDLVFEGDGEFKFALLDRDGETVFWSNDEIGSSGGEPVGSVSLPVERGLYSVRLGDTGLENMAALQAEVFSEKDLRLRVWFSDGEHGFQQLSPDQPIGSAPYAFEAERAAEAKNVAVGSIRADQLDPEFASDLARLSGDAVFAGNVTAERFSGSFSGDGSELENVFVESLVRSLP